VARSISRTEEKIKDDLMTIKKADEEYQAQAIGAFMKLYRKGLPCGRRNLSSLGISTSGDVFRRVFPEGARSLELAAREAYPDSFWDQALEHFTHWDSENRPKAGSRFVITTAEQGHEVNAAFLGALEDYCRIHNATLLILPIISKYGKHIDAAFDKRLGCHLFVVDDSPLNESLKLSMIPIPANQLNPLQGLARFGPRGGSFILGSPKQFLEIVPVSNSKLPHAIMSTGCVTMPKYGTTRQDYLAVQDHTFGAIIVEIVDKHFFHFRQLQADSREGSIIDLGQRYHKYGYDKVPIEALVLGDWHSGRTASYARTHIFEFIKAYRPKIIVLHDFFDGTTVNPHEWEKRITRARSYYDSGPLSYELERASSDLDEFLAISGSAKTLIARSNHDEMLDRYLESGRWTKEPINYHVASELNQYMLDGKNPLAAYIEKRLSKDERKRVRFLSDEEDVKIGGVQIACHGHLGPNGARGSYANLDQALGPSMTAHAHTPRIWRNHWRAGTSSEQRLGYNKGPSSWLWTFGLVYGNGSRQLINIIPPIGYKL
jgi:hypothetical protein